MRNSLQPASQQVRLLTRSRTFTSSATPETRQRPSHSYRPRTPKPSYQVNRLAAELDNPFQEGVRFVTPEDESAWERIWVTEPDRQDSQQHRERIQSIADQLNFVKHNASQIKKNPFSPYRISESDLYSLALLGSPDPNAPIQTSPPAATQSPNAILHRVLRKNAILGRCLNDTDAIQLMLSARDDIKPGAAAQFLRSSKFLDPSDVVKATVNTTDFVQWRRHISTTIQDLGSLDIAMGQEKALAAAYATLSGPLDTDSEALALLNNLVINLTRRDKVISKYYCFLGLSLACRMVSVPSISRYLSIGLKEGYFVPHDGAWPSYVQPVRPRTTKAWKTPYGALNHALSILLTLVERPQIFPTNSHSSRVLLADLFVLLTGCGLRTNETQPSFRAAIGTSAQYFPAYAQYIRLLGNLGAIRLLWHEYHSTTGHETPIYPDLGTSGTTPNLKDKLFAMAVSTVPRSLSYCVVGARGFGRSSQQDYGQDCLSQLKILQSAQVDFGYGVKRGPETCFILDIRSGAMDDLKSASLGLDMIGDVKDAMEAPFEDSMSAIQHVLSTTATAK